MQIPELYKNVNTNLLPEIIYKKLSELSHEKTISGNPALPKFYKKKIKDIEFYIPSYVLKQIDDLKDFEGNSINLTKNCYLYEYGKGFINGYKDFGSDINTNDLLEPDKLEKANKIIGFLFNIFDKKGSIIEEVFWLPNKTEKKEIEKNGKKEVIPLEVWDISEANFYITKDNFYNAGYEAGKYYRALKEVLNNHLFFEPIFNKIFKKNYIGNIQTKEKKFPFYCEIGALFAQGLIRKKGFDLFFNNKRFISINELSKYIKNDILKTDKTVKNYINDTLNNNGIKNFYNSKTKMKNILEYCQKNNINITSAFLERYEKLKEI